MGKHRKTYGKMKSSSINHIKISSRSNKHVKRGRKGKNCIYFNHDKLTCNYYKSIYYNKFCESSDCDYYTEGTKQSENINCNTNINSNLSNYDKTYIKEPLQVGRHESTNEYRKLSRNIGTSVYVGYLKSDSKRRHKHRCIYFDKNNNYCKYKFMTCTGSSHCKKYQENK